jgi:hypothetical protein
MMPPTPSADLKQFLDSMELDYYRWHDGDGFDIAALKRLSPAETEAALKAVIDRVGWECRDVEVFEAVATPRALEMLELYAGKADQAYVRLCATQALARLHHRIDAERLWLLDLFDNEALDYGDLGPLLATLPGLLTRNDSVPLREAMQRCALRGTDVSPYTAAMLYCLAGLTDSWQGWGSFPTLNKLDSRDPAVLANARREFLRILGTAPPFTPR